MTKEAHHTAPLRYRPPPCKYCGKMTTRVTNTWSHERASYIVRRIKCHSCHRAYKTTE